MLAFSHQRVTFCFPAYIELEALLFLAHNIFAALPPSFLLVYSLAVLDLEHKMEHTMMVMSFLVPMSVSFRSLASS